MTEKKEMLIVRANVELTADCLKAVVENLKKISEPDEKGLYRVDPADKVSEMISRFLRENDFEAFVKDSSNYAA